MNNDNLLQATERFVRDRLAGESTGHDWWHAHRVRNMARRLHLIEGGDWLVIELACLLHDVGDRKVIRQEDDDYSIAETFLLAEGASETLTGRIMSIVRTMSYSHSLDGAPTDTSLEFQIVQDSDRLDAIGAIGIARTFAFGGSKGRPLYDPTSTAQHYQSSEEYKQSTGSSYHHFEEKLLHISSLLNTVAARSVAAGRDAYMRDFLTQFLREWEGDA